MRAKQALGRFRAPDERAAEDRGWEVVRSAYQERLPVNTRRSYRRPVGAMAAAVALAGAVALSPAGATVGRLITRALGVQHAAPALSSLPSPGRLLVSGSAGSWTVSDDGAIRRIGSWHGASWSPHGLYLVVAGTNELAALTPRGRPQWTLARPRVSDPTWYSPTGYRVAYLSEGDLRVVAGDGTGDHLLARRVARVAPAWRPGSPYQLAYLSAGGRLVVHDADTGRTLWSVQTRSVHKLAWSADGKHLLAISSRRVLAYTAGGSQLAAVSAPGGAPIVDAALSPDGHTLALVSGGMSSAAVVENLDGRASAVRRVLAGPGLGQVAWSPDGGWVLISWPAANQWVFVHVTGRPRIVAVSRIAQQFSIGTSRTFPQLEGWCCSATGAAG